MNIKVVYNRIKAATSQIGRITLDSSTTNRMVAKVVKGLFLLIQIVSDALNLTETLAKVFGKKIDDTATTNEQTSVGFNKSLTDSVNATDDILGVADPDDQQNMDYDKESADSTGFSDVQAFNVGKALSDSGNATDSASIASDKVLSEAPNAADDETRAFGKYLGLDTDQDYVTDGYFWDDYVVGSSTEILDVNEQISLQPSKPLADSATFGDSVIRQADYSRSLADTVYATDDVIGQAGVDDQQNMQFWKFTTEVPVVSENIKLALGFTKADSAVANESTVIDFGRYLSDSPVATDSTSFGYGKDFTESPAFTDSNVIAFNKPLTEGTISSDQAVLSVNQTRSDSASSSDSGVLLNQDYVASSDYFADDYVGAKRAI